MKHRKRWWTHGRAALAGAMAFPPTVFAFGLAFADGKLLPIVVAGFVMFTDAAIVVAATYLHYHLRRPASRPISPVRPAGAPTVQLERIVDAEYQRIGGLY